MKKPTKDELIKKVATLEAEVKRLSDSDATVRTALSVALDAPFKQAEYGYSKSEERHTYSWFAIFREVGKLLQRDKEQDQRARISSLEAEIERRNCVEDEHMRKYHPNGLTP